MWLSRAGKALRGELAGLGAKLEPTRLTEDDGTRPNGYTLQAIKDAASALDAAA